MLIGVVVALIALCLLSFYHFAEPIISLIHVPSLLGVVYLALCCLVV
jgi:hypothetical protein